MCTMHAVYSRYMVGTLQYTTVDAVQVEECRIERWCKNRRRILREARCFPRVNRDSGQNQLRADDVSVAMQWIPRTVHIRAESSLRLILHDYFVRVTSEEYKNCTGRSRLPYTILWMAATLPDNLFTCEAECIHGGTKTQAFLPVSQQRPVQIV